MNILMMVFGTGPERRAAGFAALFERTGLQLVGITPTAGTLGIVEARPA